MVWNATATLIAIIITSSILDEAGFFKWAALHIARWGNGRTSLLFTLIVLFGAVVAGLLTNDGAALILTPIVMELLLALGFRSEEHTSELQSLMRISYAVFCLNKKTTKKYKYKETNTAITR